MNGSVMPFDGASWTLTIMLISACKPNSMTRPAAARIASDDREIERGDGEAGDEAELLADDREDVIGVRLGKAELPRAAARSHAEQPARGQRPHRILDLEIVAGSEQELVDPLGRDIVEEISEDDPDDARDGEPREDAQVQPGEREHCDPHGAEDDRRSEVGLLHQ